MPRKKDKLLCFEVKNFQLATSANLNLIQKIEEKLVAMSIFPAKLDTSGGGICVSYDDFDDNEQKRVTQVALKILQDFGLDVFKC